MGWVFPDSDKEVPGAERDHINGAKSVRELYDIASLNYTGKYTVPVSHYYFIYLMCLYFKSSSVTLLVSLFEVGSLG